MLERISDFLSWIRNIFEVEVEKTEMKYIIVGLGNIGEEYNHTRHNIGFDVLDEIAEQKAVKFKVESYAAVCQVKHKGRIIHLVKPTTYMNRSGKAVKYWMNKYKVDKANVLVVLDDLNLDFGKLRMRAKGSSGGHNGLKDIEQSLGGSDYSRLRVGIGDTFGKGKQIDFVLGKWDKKEQDYLPEIITKSAQASLSFTSIGMKFTMEKFNGKVFSQD